MRLITSYVCIIFQNWSCMTRLGFLKYFLGNLSFHFGNMKLMTFKVVHTDVMFKLISVTLCCVYRSGFIRVKSTSITRGIEKCQNINREHFSWIYPCMVSYATETSVATTIFSADNSTSQKCRRRKKRFLRRKNVQIQILLLEHSSQQ